MKKGICHICGKGRKLSEEHTPPRSSGNSLPAIKLPLTKVLQDGRIDFRGQYPDREGLRYPTLCESCNQFTGNNYVKDFSEFCLKGSFVQSKSISILPVAEIYPLRIIKEIFVIMCAISSDGWIQKVKGLKDFLLNKYRTKLDYSFKMYMYLLAGSIGRSIGGSMVGDDRNSFHYVSEFSFPPFGFVLTEDGFQPDRRLKDITYFREFGYSDRHEFTLELNVLPNRTYYPLSFNENDPKYNYCLLGAATDIHLRTEN